MCVCVSVWGEAWCSFSGLLSMGDMSLHSLKSFLVPISLFLLYYIVIPLPIVQWGVKDIFPIHTIATKDEFHSVRFAVTTKIEKCYFICILIGLEKVQYCILFLFYFFFFYHLSNRGNSWSFKIQLLLVVNKILCEHC